MERKTIFDKVKAFGKKAVQRVKDDPIGTLLLVASVGLSAYSAVTTVKRNDELTLTGFPDATADEPVEEEPVAEETTDVTE